MAKTFGGYPQSASNRAKAALNHREKNGTSCGTAVGWQRANQLASREKLTMSTIKRTYSFLSRAKTYDQGKFTDADGRDICGSIMYAAWGGDSMKSWAESTIKKEEKREMEDNKELRSLQSSFELRAEGEDKKPVVEGYAVRFEESTTIGGQFSESVSRDAFKNTDMSNVVALFNHDWNMPLARAGHGLELEMDENGLKYRFELGEQSYAKDLAENIRMGNVSTSSFGFTIKKDKWEKRDGVNHRTILEVEKLYDVSPTTQGAYPTTDVALRSMEEALSEISEEEIMAEVAEKEDNHQEVVVEAADQQVAEIVEPRSVESELVDEIIDKSILPHPYAVEADKRTEIEPEAQTQTKMANNAEKNAPAYIQGLGDSEAQARSKFSFGKMIKEASQGKLTGLEAEINQEGRSEFSGSKVNVAGGICIPSFVLRTDALPMGHEAVGSQTEGFGGTIGTADLGIIESFRPNDIASQLGARNLTNLTGDIVFQVQSTNLDATKATEGAKVDSANAAFTPKSLAPQRYSTHTRVTDQMLAQSADDMGAFLAMDIRRSIDAKFNVDIVAAIKAAAQKHGSPAALLAYASNNPLNLEEKLLENDVDLGNVVGLSGATAYRELRTLSHDAGSGMLFAESPLNRRQVMGYATTISSSVTATEFYMVDRTQLITGTWGGLNLIIDPYSDADYGVTRIVANVYRNVLTLQADGFEGLSGVGA